MCIYGISGHSERRTLFHETSELVAEKTRAAIDAGLTVILCVGETLEQREAGKTAQVVESQLGEVVKVNKESDWQYVLHQLVTPTLLSSRNCISNIVIAYEPVWAIGTGKVATSAQVSICLFTCVYFISDEQIFTVR